MMQPFFCDMHKFESLISFYKIQKKVSDVNIQLNICQIEVFTFKKLNKLTPKDD